MAGEMRGDVQGDTRRHWVKNAVIVLALVGAGFALAWLRFRPFLEHDGGFTDGRGRLELSEVERLRYAVWDPPEPLAGAVNGPGDESRTTVSPDGRWVVFASGERGVDADLFVGAFDGERVDEVRPLFELNGAFDDVAPRFGATGLFFASNRPGGAGGLDLYRAPYVVGAFGEASFGEPERLAGAINTEGDDTDPAPVPGSARGGREALVLARADARRGSGAPMHDLVLAEPVRDADGGAAWHVTALDELNSPQDEREPAFGRDGASLVFASDRGRGRALERARDDDFDLYRSAKLTGARAEFGARFEAWGPPEPIDALNTEADERAPDPSADGFALRFARDLGEGARGEILLARSRELFRTPGDPVGWEELLLVLALVLLAILAWAAKHWRAMDVVYRCFVVSLIAHLALMWWLQRVHPSAQVEQVVRHGPRVRVQLTDPSAEVERRTARGGELDVARSEPVANATAPAVALPMRAERATDALADANERAQPAPAELARAAAPTVTTASDRAHEAEARRSEDAASRRAPVAYVDARAELAAAQRPAALVAVSLPDGPRDEVALARTARVEPDRSPARPSPRPSPTGEAGDGTSNGADGAERLAARPGRLDLAPRRFERAAPSAPELGVRAEPAAPSAVHRDVELADATLARADASTAAEQVAEPAPDTATARAPGAASFERATPAESAAPAPGSLSFERRATPPSDLAPPRPRALELTAAAPPAPAPAPEPVAWDATPYRSRRGAAKAEALRTFGGSEATEAAVRDGLRYLASIQAENGAWGSSRDDHDKYGDVRIGKTGLCLLAFLGAGHTPDSGTEHSAVVVRGLRFLLEQQRDTGHVGDCASYGHGIATYALAEAFALTPSADWRVPLERAVAHVVHMQITNARRAGAGSRDVGGWGYYTSDGPFFDDFARTSITSWQVMALESARLAGLFVPDVAFDRARRFLAAAWDERLGAFRYSHDRQRLNSGWPTLPGSTPAAMFALGLLGADLAHTDFDAPRSWVLERAPTSFRYTSDDAFVERGQGNLYFVYYGTLALFRTGGDAWDEWNVALQELLLDTQSDDGSWTPISTYAREHAGDDRRDASYTTALAVLSLEVYYRYFTPLLQIGSGGRSSEGSPAAVRPDAR